MSLSGCEVMGGVCSHRSRSAQPWEGGPSPRQHQTLRQGMQGVPRPGGHGRRPDIQAWQPGWLAEREPEAPAGSAEHPRPLPQLYSCSPD